MIKSTSNYPVEVLRKTRAVLETNLRGAPGMFISAEALSRYQRQMREVNKAIEYLELLETSKRKRREAVLK